MKRFCRYWFIDFFAYRYIFHNYYYLKNYNVQKSIINLKVIKLTALTWKLWRENNFLVYSSVIYYHKFYKKYHLYHVCPHNIPIPTKELKAQINWFCNGYVVSEMYWNVFVEKYNIKIIPAVNENLLHATELPLIIFNLHKLYTLHIHIKL